MNISKEQIDDLNAVVTVSIEKDDYQNQVDKILKDYRKNANIPGFRKGHVPLGLIKKQYGKAVLVDEVNKLLQKSLSSYLVEEKLDVLGDPLPKNQKDFDWNADSLSFQFELGLAPNFEISTGGPIPYYKIKVTDEMIDNQVETIRKQYGKLIAQDQVQDGFLVKGTFVNEEKEIEKNTVVELDDVKEDSKKLFLGAKVGDTITIPITDIYKKESFLKTVFSITPEDKESYTDTEVLFTIEEINERIPAELNQELFDKLFGEGQVQSVEDLQTRIKEESEAQFVQQSDQHFLNAATEQLLEHTLFELPADFLQKWILMTNEKSLSEEQAKEEYEKSEKGLRYQLIEGKIMKDNDIQIDKEDVINQAKTMVRAQMAQFGHLDPSDEELNSIASRVLSNQEETKRISDQIVSQKLLEYYKNNLELDTKEVTFDEFVKEVYQ